MKDKKKKPPARRSAASPDLMTRLGDVVINYDFLILFVLIAIIYNTATNINVSGDTIPASFLPIVFIQHQTVFFDSMIPAAGPGSNLAYAFPLVNGHYVSLFPIVTPILAIPVYFVSYVLLSFAHIPVDKTMVMVMMKTSATVIAALSCVFVYLTAKELISKKAALITTLVYAFATSTWSVSAQALWQHGITELLLIIMVYLIIRNERQGSAKNILLLGLLSGLFFFNRPPDVVLLLPVIGYMIWYERGRLPVYGAAAAVTGLPFLIYNVLIFGNIFGGYRQNLGFFTFGPESLLNFTGLLLAPNVGLLIFSPVLVLSVIGYLKLQAVSQERVRRVLVVFGPVIIVQILVYSFFGLWESSVAYSYGQRFLTGLIPVLAIYTGIVFEEYFIKAPDDVRTKAARTAIVLLIVVSVVIQAIGVFLYPLYPDRSTSGERTWDWQHSIVTETFSYGISRISSFTVYTLPPLPPLFQWGIPQK
jgi:hypothetical protein